MIDHPCIHHSFYTENCLLQLIDSAFTDDPRCISKDRETCGYLTLVARREATKASGRKQISRKSEAQCNKKEALDKPTYNEVLDKPHANKKANPATPVVE